MNNELINFLLFQDVNNHIQPNESLQDWFIRLKENANILASDENTSSEILAILAKYDVDLKRRIVCNQNADYKTLLQLATDNDWCVRYQLAQHTCYSSILSILSNDKDNEIRYLVAGNDYTTISDLEKLANDQNINVREQVFKKHIKKYDI